MGCMAGRSLVMEDALVGEKSDWAPWWRKALLRTVSPCFVLGSSKTPCSAPLAADNIKGKDEKRF